LLGHGHHDDVEWCPHSIADAEYRTPSTGRRALDAEHWTIDLDLIHLYGAGHVNLCNVRDGVYSACE
jgi:hypothetical protein